MPAQVIEVAVPGIRGSAGKSAYQTAVEGGFGGAEEDFAPQLADLPNKLTKDTYDPTGKNADAFDRTKHAGAMPLSGYGLLSSVSLETITVAQALNLSTVPVVLVNQRTADAPQSLAAYLKAASEPGHDFKFQDASGGWRELDFRTTVDAGAFGFTGTDPVADTAAIAKARNALKGKGHKVLRFPACTSVINPYDVVTGTGQGISFLLDEGLSNLTIEGAGHGLTKFHTASNKHKLFSIRGARNVTLRNLSLINPPRLYGGESMLSTLPGSLAASATSITVTSGTESAFAAVSNGDR